MSILEVFFISIGIAMDAFAVSICKGAVVKKITKKKMLLIGFYFAFFHALMPTIGYFLGTTFENFVSQIDHWLAFFLLVLIGSNMIRETRFQNQRKLGEEVNFKSLMLPSLAISMDALVVGTTFAFFNTNLLLVVIMISTITFLLSMVGLKIGNLFGTRYQKKAGVFGGILLIFLGIKILLEHLM